jgi:hypothetical protein
VAHAHRQLTLNAGRLDSVTAAAHTPNVNVSPLPKRGGVSFDRRDDGRALRVSAHPETSSVTISIWRDDRCVATHQLLASDVPQVIELLASALVPTRQPGQATAS